MYWHASQWNREEDLQVFEHEPIHESFEDFFVRERTSVFGLAVALTGSRPEAEEITQDAFVAVLASWERVSRMEDPGAWVRRVVSNRSVSRFRRRRTERAWEQQLRQASREPQPSLSPDFSVDVWREVRRLPRRQAQVVALHYLHDRSRRDVAVVLQLSEETVKTHLERARLTLAKRLNQEGTDQHDHR